MPIARIETSKSRSPQLVGALIEAVIAAQVEALKVPESDRQVRYLAYPPGQFTVPPDKSEDFTIVEISIFPGRSLQAKKNLYRGIVQRFEALGIAPRDVTIVLHEPPLANWGIAGGQPACEVDLGFKLDV